MKIAITGGAGFIGARLTRAFLDAGHDVLVIDNLSRGTRQATDPRARFYHIDIRDAKLHTILQHEQPAIVSHHVVQWSQDQPFAQSLVDADVHIRGLLHVLDCCVNASVGKFIYASGGNDLYTPTEGMPLPLAEDTPLHPRHFIDVSRVAAEWYIRHYTQYYGLPHTILRYADVYGETERTHLSFPAHPLSYFIAMLQEQRRPIIRGSGDEVRDHIHIDDVVQANLCALRRGENQTLHISSGQGYTLNQLYHMVALFMRTELEPVYISGSLAEPAAVALDNTRAQQVLGWKPQVGLAAAIRDMIARMSPTREPITEPLVEQKTRVAEPVMAYEYSRA